MPSRQRIAACFLLAGVVSAIGPTAKTTWGTLQGIEQSTLSDAPFYTTCDAFLGVPYAAPPTGDLRFENPVAWNESFAGGKRAAVAYGAACPQTSETGSMGSEDCLTLNVWRPSGTKPGEKLPIMTFIHGGAFVGGSGAGLAPNLLLNTHSGCALAGRYKMVIATVNYRLGPFGFLFTQGAGGATSGNFGLKDQREALRWLMREADSFGADAATHTAALKARRRAATLSAGADTHCGGAVGAHRRAPRRSRRPPCPRRQSFYRAACRRHCPCPSRHVHDS